MRCFLASLALAALTIGTASAETRNGPELVIADNDYLGPGGPNIQSVIPLAEQPETEGSWPDGRGWR